MSYGNSRRLNDLDERLKLLHFVENGQMTNLPCPRCGFDMVNAWFTNPLNEVYKLWFICDKCTLEVRVQLSNRPSFFDQRRVNLDLEARDRTMLDKEKFRDPFAGPGSTPCGGPKGTPRGGTGTRKP